jgi:hypothetical protein
MATPDFLSVPEAEIERQLDAIAARLAEDVGRPIDRTVFDEEMSRILSSEKYAIAREMWDRNDRLREGTVRRKAIEEACRHAARLSASLEAYDAACADEFARVHAIGGEIVSKPRERVARLLAEHRATEERLQEICDGYRAGAGRRKKFTDHTFIWTCAQTAETLTGRPVPKASSGWFVRFVAGILDITEPRLEPRINGDLSNVGNQVEYGLRSREVGLDNGLLKIVPQKPLKSSASD